MTPNANRTSQRFLTHMRLFGGDLTVRVFFLFVFFNLLNKPAVEMPPSHLHKKNNREIFLGNRFKAAKSRNEGERLGGATNGAAF